MLYLCNVPFMQRQSQIYKLLQCILNFLGEILFVRTYTGYSPLDDHNESVSNTLIHIYDFF